MKHLLTVFFMLVMMQSMICPAGSFASGDRQLEIRELVTTFITTRTAGLGWDVSIRRINVPDSLKLPEGPIDYEILAPQQWEGWGNLSIAVLARQNGRIVSNIPVRMDVEALADTVITTHQIEQGSSITTDDLVLQKREISQSSSRASRKLSDIVGKKARTTIKANQAVRPDQVEKVPIIKSGQIVTIIAENDLMKVSVTGKARSSGAEGDIVMVQNQNSLKEIPARVINATTVQVAF